MAKVTQLVLNLQSKPGVLAKVADALGKAGVNIEGVCAAETAGRGKIRLLVSDAVTAIDKGRVAAGATHPVQVYLIQAELAAFRNLQSAQQTLGEGDDRALPAARRADAQRLLKELKCQTKRLEAADTIVVYWERTFTLTPEPGPC